MKNRITKILSSGMVFAVVVMMATLGLAQNASKTTNDNQMSSDNVSISGTVIVKSGQGMTKDASEYYLDENDDGQADYQLQFNKNKADFTEPEDGATVTITGSMSGSSEKGLPVIQVSKLKSEKSGKSDNSNGMSGDSY